MSHNQLDTLVHMVNQIATNNAAYDTDEAAQRVANHLQRFWARRMKQMIIDYNLSGGDDLSPIARLAVTQLSLATHSEQQENCSVGQS